ncbi:MAG: rod shape-determining protein MreD [Chlorobi bacterium]|nr:rod shape-determining protein MreD [Chlorobiota bacterium]
MIKVILRNIICFVLIVLFQVLVLNNVQFSSLLNPFVYTLFILLLPFEISGWFLLILAFILGFSIDAFTNTPGLHASATVFMASFRPMVLRGIAPRDDYEIGTFPRLSQYGFAWFVKYTVILVFIHHLFYFVIEAFSSFNLLTVLARTFISSIVAIFLIVLSQFIIFRD